VTVLSGQDSRVEGVMVNDGSMRAARLVNRERLYVGGSRRRWMFESIPTTQKRTAALWHGISKKKSAWMR